MTFLKVVSWVVMILWVLGVGVATLRVITILLGRQPRYIAPPEADDEPQVL